MNYEVIIGAFNLIVYILSWPSLTQLFPWTGTTTNLSLLQLSRSSNCPGRMLQDNNIYSVTTTAIIATETPRKTPETNRTPQAFETPCPHIPKLPPRRLTLVHGTRDSRFPGPHKFPMLPRLQETSKIPWNSSTYSRLLSILVVWNPNTQKAPEKII